MENLSLLNSSVQDLASKRKILTTSDAKVDCKAEGDLHRSIDDFDSFAVDDNILPGKAFMGPNATNSVDDESPTNAISLYKLESDSSITSPSSVPPPPPPPPPLLIPPPPPFIKPPFGKTRHGSFQDDRSSTKLRRLIWEKIPDIQIMNADDSIWAESQSQIKVDFQTIDDLFTVENCPSKTKYSRHMSITTISSELGESDASDDSSKRKISLLDSKRSLNIHIFLRQFKRSIEVLAESIRACEMSFMNYDRLLSLRKLLPNTDEIKILQEFKGPPSNLDSADYFLLCVISIPHYKIRIDLMLLREEFDHAIGQINQSLLMLKQAMQEIRGCYALPSILHLVLQAGNYLNRGASFGNASGFRLASLKALTDTKANKPGITLMHYVAMELKKNDPTMMNWTKEVSSVDNAARISEEEIKEQIKTFQKRVEILKRKVAEEGDDDLRQNAEKFLKKAEANLDSTCVEEKKLMVTSAQLATYLCENPHRFALSNCFEIVAEFRKKFIKATLENAKREETERKRESKNRREDQNNNYKLSSMNKNNNTSVDEHTMIEEERLSWLKKKNSLRRSFSLATPHRPYHSLHRQSAGKVDVAGTKNSSNGLHDISIVISSPPEEKMHQQEIGLFSNDDVIASKITKVAWEGPESLTESDAPNKNENVKMSDANTILNGSHLVPESKLIVHDNKFLETKKQTDRLKNGLNSSTDVNKHFDTESKESSQMTLKVPTARLRVRTSKNEKRERSKSLLAVDSNAKNFNDDDLEKSMNRFVQRERDRMFERTQLRRSYVCLPKDEDELASQYSDESDSDTSRSDRNNRNGSSVPAYVRRKQFQRRFSPLASQSDTVLSTSHNENTDLFSENASRALEKKSETQTVLNSRHDDIRERIRRYKESTSSNKSQPSLDRRRSSNSSMDITARRSSEHDNIPNQCDLSFDEPEQPTTTSPSPSIQRKAEKDFNKSSKYASATFAQLSAMDERPERSDSDNASFCAMTNEANCAATVESETTKELNTKSSTELNQQEPECVTLDVKKPQIRSGDESQGQNSTLVRRNSSLLRCRTSASGSKVVRQSIHFPITETISSRLESSPKKQNLILEKSDRTFSSKSSSKTSAYVTKMSTSTLKALKSPTKKKSVPSVSGVKTLISKLTQSKKKQGKDPSNDEKKAKVTSKQEFKTKTSQVKEVTPLHNVKPGHCNAPTKTKDVSVSPRKPGLDKKLTIRPSPITSANTSKPASPSPRKYQPIQKNNVSPCRPASRSSGIIPPSSNPVAASAVNLNKAARLKQNKLQKQDFTKPTIPDYSKSLPKTPRSSTLPRRAVSPAKPASSPKYKTLTKKSLSEPERSEASVSKVKPLMPGCKTLHKSDKQPSSKRAIVKGIAIASPSPEAETSKNLQEVKETDLNDDKDEKEKKADKDHVSSNTPVQMNRAARLRLSKKLSNKNTTTKSMLI